MNGELDFTQALEARLSIINPTCDGIERFISLQKVDGILTPGMKTLIKLLMKNGITVCLVSGGLLPLVMCVASALRIPKENVYANRLIFSENGNYKDFDRTLPTSRTDGKAEVVRSLMQRLDSLVAVVGDGMTDARACPPAEVFIGFGANVERPAVKACTQFFCSSVAALTELLESVGLLDQIVKQ